MEQYGYKIILNTCFFLVTLFKLYYLYLYIFINNLRKYERMELKIPEEWHFYLRNKASFARSLTSMGVFNYCQKGKRQLVDRCILLFQW